MSTASTPVRRRRTRDLELPLRTPRERAAWARSTAVFAVDQDERFAGVTLLRAITENA